MTNKDKLMSVVFPKWYEGLAEFEHTYKGYLNDVRIKMASGKVYTLSFVVNQRLGQSLADNVSAGLSYFTEKNLVVIPSIERAIILKAINDMHKDELLENMFLSD